MISAISSSSPGIEARVDMMKKTAVSMRPPK
jgi:hypothetical protein